MRIIVCLAPDRDNCGALTVVNEVGLIMLGPVPVAARALDDPASANGNPTRSPLLTYGDPPSGRYRLARILGTGRGTRYPAKSFGAAGFILLRAVAGDAALAEANGRFHMIIQAGQPGRNSRLKATDGGFRISDTHMKQLVSLLCGEDQIAFDCVEDAGQASLGQVDISSTSRFAGPSLLAVQSEVSTATRRRVIGAGMGALAGAVAVNFSGMFIALGIPAEAYAQNTAYPSPSSQEAAPPGTYLNSTQQGQPPASATQDAPPGTYLNSTQQGQPSSPRTQDGSPGSYLNSTQQVQTSKSYP